MLRFLFHLSEPYTNNEVECEAIIVNLKLVIFLEIQSINIYENSQMMVNQIVWSYKFLKPKLLQYHQYTLELLKQNLEVSIYWLLGAKKAMVDVLAMLAKHMACSDDGSTSTKVHNRLVLAPIDMELIERCALEGELDSIK